MAGPEMLVAVLCGVGCLALLFLLLARYGREVLGGHSVTYVAQHRECHPMVRVHNPFTVAASGDNAGKVGAATTRVHKSTKT